MSPFFLYTKPNGKRIGDQPLKTCQWPGHVHFQLLILTIVSYCTPMAVLIHSGKKVSTIQATVLTLPSTKFDLWVSPYVWSRVERNYIYRFMIDGRGGVGVKRKRQLTLPCTMFDWWVSPKVPFFVGNSIFEAGDVTTLEFVKCLRFDWFQR